MARCSKTVWYGSGFPSRQCSRTESVERNGKPWCKQHDPERVAVKRKERSEAFDRKWAEREQRQKEAAQQQAELERKAALVEELLTALSRLYTFPGVRDLLAPKESLGSIAAEVEVAIAKAEALIGPAKG